MNDWFSCSSLKPESPSVAIQFKNRPQETFYPAIISHMALKHFADSCSLVACPPHNHCHTHQWSTGSRTPITWQLWEGVDGVEKFTLMWLNPRTGRRNSRWESERVNSPNRAAHLQLRQCFFLLAVSWSKKIHSLPVISCFNISPLTPSNWLPPANRRSR